MKTVWILNHYAQELAGSGSTRHYSLAKNLLRHGWRGIVLAADFDVRTGRRCSDEGDRSQLFQYEGVRFLRIRTPSYCSNNHGRVFNMLAYTAQAILPSTTRSLPRPDAIVGSSVHPFTAWAGAVLARRFDVPFIFEVRDLWPQTLIDLGRLAPQSLTTHFLRALEKWLYRKAKCIIVLLPKAADYITSLGIDAGKIEWIPNGVELEGYRRPEPAPARETFTLMYFGAHGLANGLDCVVEAMAVVQKEVGPQRVRLRLIGDGPEKRHLIDLAKKKGLHNVKFEEFVPKHLIPSVAQEADGFIFNLVDLPVFKFGISSNKLFDFMAAGRPIIFCCKSSNNPVIEADAGLTVSPGDAPALARAILQLARTPLEERARMGISARTYVEKNHGYDSLAKNLAQVLDKLIRGENEKSV